MMRVVRTIADVALVQMPAGVAMLVQAASDTTLTGQLTGTFNRLSHALEALSPAMRVLVILLAAVIAHFLVRAIRGIGEWVVVPSTAPGEVTRDLLRRRHPRVATVTGLIISALTFVIYFLAFGLVLREMAVSLTAYLATASVLGLAVAFGMQGLVQDIVIGLTLLFSKTFDVGDTIELSGQVGRVEAIGLRFTTLVTLNGQLVFIPNRTIGMVARFRRGAIRAYVDVQIPKDVPEEEVQERVTRIANGMRSQHGTILTTDPEVLGVAAAGADAWRFLRVKFRLWPGQGALIETVFRQRVIASMRELDAGYHEWMVSVTYRAN